MFKVGIFLRIDRSAEHAAGKYPDKFEDKVVEWLRPDFRTPEAAERIVDLMNNDLDADLNNVRGGQKFSMYAAA